MAPRRLSTYFSRCQAQGQSTWLAGVNEEIQHWCRCCWQIWVLTVRPEPTLASTGGGGAGLGGACLGFAGGAGGGGAGFVALGGGAGGGGGAFGGGLALTAGGCASALRAGWPADACGATSAGQCAAWRSHWRSLCSLKCTHPIAGSCGCQRHSYGRRSNLPVTSSPEAAAAFCPVEDSTSSEPSTPPDTSPCALATCVLLRRGLLR